MHQQSRHSPRMSSPASSPQTNPTRTNNPREATSSRTSRTSSDGRGSQLGFSGGEMGEYSSSGPSRETVKKMDQIIQNYFSKAAVLIVQSRIKVTPSGGKNKVSQWFQIQTDEIEEFRDELKIYKQSGGYDSQTPPMIIETYLDASRLNSSQTLVAVDDNGKRSDVLEALNSSETSSDGSNRSRTQRRNNEVILERWRVELKCIPDEVDDFGPVLPNIYKRSIIFFRSLYIMTQLLPAFKFAQVQALHPALVVKCRIVTQEPESHGFDSLRQPLFDDGREPVTEYMFGDMEIPVGRFLSSITYRNDCHFRVDNSESLLSSRFMGVDENFFKPTLTQQRREYGRTEGYTEVGSLPAHMRGRDGQEAQQTYGSLSTFHGAGALGTSPMSALRAVRPAGSETSSLAGSFPGSIDQDPSHSLPMRSSGQSSISRPSLRNLDSSRRPSVSQAINPFKNGSLSGSPRLGEGEPPASPSQSSHSRIGSYSGLSQHRPNRSSLTAGMAASLRGGPPPGATVGDQAVAGSPKPQMTSRYSSSFTHRRGRPSFGGQSRPGDDDQVSSGRQSLSSSVQPGSSLLNEAGGAASSGSFQADDDNLSDFLKALDSRKTLKSFEPSQKGESSAAAKRTAAQLSKFALMRESNNALTESMTSSMHLRSSSSSSRQLANVPSMVNPASMSTCSSPGMKPLSPHTPHTPAIPSRLSENSIIDYPGGQRHGSHRLATTADTVSEADGEDGDGDCEDTQVPVSQEGTTAIDIPLSPRVLQAVGSTNRRASSVAHQNRASTAAPPLPEDDDADVLGQRSISLGADGREAPTLSTLLGLQRPPNRDNGGKKPSSGAGEPGASLRPSAANRSSSSIAQSSGKARDNEEIKNDSPDSLVLSGAPYRPRYSSRGSGGVRPSSSRGSFFGGSGPRYGDGADDEPLVFAMSELERDSRRSLEDQQQGRGSGSVGPGNSRSTRDRDQDRTPGFEPRGLSRRGW